VTGSAGTGKTTLCAALGAQLGLPVVPEGMREYLERTGVDLHDFSPQQLRALVEDLWAERVVAEAQPAWIADRCSVDFGAFWLLYRFHHQRDAATDRFMATFRERAAVYDRIVVLPLGGIALQRDGIRSANHWIQLNFQLLLDGLLARWVPPERVLSIPATVDSVVARTRWVSDRL